MGSSESFPDVKRGDFLINENEIQSGKYQIEAILGQGVFGKVVKCVKVDTDEKMAVKIVKKCLDWAGKREVAVLKKLRNLDHDKNNLVKFTEHFMHKEYICLAFELLDQSIWDFMAKRNFKSLHLSEIRVITQQMLVAVKALNNIGLVHTDIKPDNLMLVNHTLQPLRVKLIDFGLACPAKKIRQGKTIQAVNYRAPEVFLGLPLTEAIDMWSVGCVAAFMYLGQHLYVGDYASEVMRVITQIHGQPEDHLLDLGIKTLYYFKKDKDSPTSPWRPNTPHETTAVTSSTSNESKSSIAFTSLDDLTKARPLVTNRFECEDTKAFLSLLKEMLQVDAEKRITASSTLEHCFITMKHISRYPKPNAYLLSARLMMKKSQLEETTVDNSTNSSNDPCSASANEAPPTTKYLNKKCMGLHGGSRTDRNNVNNCRPPVNSELRYCTAAGAVEKRCGTNEADSPISAPHSSNTNDETTGFVEIKTRKKHLKRIGVFFSRIYKYMCCISSDSIKTDHF